MKGDLRRAVRGRCFAERPRWSAHLGLRAALCTAREVALGMQHLHGVGGHHGNLTAPNVLLLESHTDRRGFVAKVRKACIDPYCTVGLDAYQPAWHLAAGTAHRPAERLSQRTADTGRGGLESPRPLPSCSSGC